MDYYNHHAQGKIINLALQGGGSHGAFTWGVLDALLEDGRLYFDAISGTSAGAMNAVVLAYGMTRAQYEEKSPEEVRQSARDALKRFWNGIGIMGSFSAGVPLPGSKQVIRLLTGLATQYVSPYQSNPLGVNPLHKLLSSVVDFDLLAEHNRIQLFICATCVRTGRGHLFHGKDITADSVMASACLPHLFQAVEIDGEIYWDGGYTGNPALSPLFSANAYRDILLIQINPSEQSKRPHNAESINERISEITFNTALLHELRNISMLRGLIHSGKVDSSEYKDILMHCISTDEALGHQAHTSKVRADPMFLKQLFQQGRQAARQWLDKHYDDLGVRQTLKIQL